MKVGVYCGSFSPVHKGHIKIAKECIKQGLVDKVLFIPTADYWTKKIEIPLNDRINMLKYYQSQYIEVEESLNSLPYTSQIFEALSKQNPNNKYKLIVGADNLENFNKWNHYQDLLAYGLIVVPRDEMNISYIQAKMKSLSCTNHEILDIKPINISSSYIRNNLDNYAKLESMLNKNIYDYLIKLRDSYNN